ncbi:MAG: ABC transporter permease [Pseudomonadota bacterium]
MSDLTEQSDADPEPLQPLRATHSIRRPFAGARTISALMLREMSTRYGRTPGGYIWAIMEPLCVIFVLALGFSLLIRSPPIGSSFVLFYASGYIVFHVYQQMSLHVSRSIVFSLPLMFYPAVTWIDAVVARAVLNALTAIMVGYITLMIVMVTLDTRTVIDVVPMIQAGLLALFFGFGVGVTNCALIGLFPTWDIIWSIITRPLFIASGILFILEDLPQTAREVLWYNPLIHIVGLFREGLYPMYTAQYVSLAYVAGLSTLLTALGLALLHRHHRDIIERG